MSTLQTLIELTLYLLAGAFSVYAGVSTLDMGLTAFTATALLTCFVASVLSLYKMLTR